MLELLIKYAEDHDLRPEPGFAEKPARWAIVCDGKGRFLQVLELGDTESKRNPGRTFPKAPELSFSELKAGGETKSHFLIESAGVVALLFKGSETEKAVAKVRAKHAYFVSLLRGAADVIAELGLFADLLDDPVALEQITTQLKGHKANPPDKVTLAIQGRNPAFLVESDAWHDWWRDFRRSLAPPPQSGGRSRKPATPRMRSFLSGELVLPAPVHRKIRGLSDVGGLAMGDALASFKQESFCSYGFKQSANAAVSEEGAVAYRAALNHLLKTTGHRLAGAKVAHWFKKRVRPEDDLLPFLKVPEQEEEHTGRNRARLLLEAIQSGRRADLQGNHFYAITLCGAAGRVMVRDWMEGPFERLVRNVDAWFEDLAIVRRDGKGMAPLPKFMAVLGGVVRDLNDLAPPFIARMWRVAVCREPIPRQALAQALARARIDVIQDNPANHARMGLMKAYHVRLKKGDGTMKECLNEDHPHPAYHCGRLMAVMADLQHAALGDVGAGVVQRYYAAASATPALVLGRLARTAQFHLNKLDSPGLRHWYEQRLADIWGRIKDDLPRTLALEDQSLFALGYYHQKGARKGKES